MNINDVIYSTYEWVHSHLNSDKNKMQKIKNHHSTAIDKKWKKNNKSRVIIYLLTREKNRHTE